MADLSEIKDQLIRNENFSVDRANEAELEAKKFLAASHLSKDNLAILNGDPDIFWHYLILNTRIYRNFCETALDYTFIDHVPVNTVDTSVKKQYGKTIEELRKYFGDPNPNHWPLDPEKMPARWCAWCKSVIEEKFPMDRHSKPLHKLIK